MLSSQTKMATNSLHYSIHHHHHSLLKRHHHHHPSETPPPPTSLFLKPSTPTTTHLTLSHHTSSNSHITSFSLSQTTPSSSSSSSSSTSQTSPSFDLLRHHLSSQNFQQADEETRRLLIVLAGEAAQKRGYVFFSEVQFISGTDLVTIDTLWREHSGNKFGYSVQKKILEKANGDFTKFFIKVGWMKKLDTEVEQYNYRSFPSEFIWDLNEDTPEGHLPLTNALRGTQLLNNVLNHPAFVDTDKEQGGKDDAGNNDNGALPGSKDNSSSPKTLSQTVFKPDYSF
ncbi:tetrapyrrole-binding protein, chloroplastic [Vigna unguiculata]|uniref:tetrapyrrole-binding protein, chloroplastic n=1 Tax=Vigna unguiculata TaxID=3917 RepID=UPI0010162DD7|nr:tetrapyrrole-binding protein, chloroplastic [Vigna unguiculata]